MSSEIVDKNIHLGDKCSKEDIENILCRFKASLTQFEIYDIFYPSPSDPGAYICYASYDVESDTFNMTLGNHGWTGGIYKIETRVILNQLYHLAQTQKNFELKVEKTMFFSHYVDVSIERNVKMNDMLLDIHKY